MTITNNRPSTPIEESTEAISSVDTHPTASLVSDTALPTINQLISEEVAIFLGTKKQTTYHPEDAERLLPNQINKRLLGENERNGLRGGLAHRPLKVLPPSVIATCILKRELRHTGLIGESEETAELVTYEDAGPDEGLYVPAEERIRRLARQYHYTISPKDLNAVVECVRDSAQLLSESEDGDVAAFANDDPEIEQPVRESIEEQGLRPDKYDFFLCHAWDDRRETAKELHDALVRAGVSVWFSENEVLLGSNLMREIDKGLSKSRAGAVLVTKSFVKRIKAEGVADKELSALLARDLLVPIVHGVTYDDLREESPLLASRSGFDTADDTMEEIATKISELVSTDAFSD